MKRLANFLVKGRIILFAVMLLISAFCAYLFTTQTPNKDMTKYLSDNSNMKQGLEVMNTEFAAPEEKSSIRVMFDNISSEQIESISQTLMKIPNVNSVTHVKDSDRYNRENHTLFIVNSKLEYDSKEFTELESAILEQFKFYKIQIANDDIQSTQVPLSLILTALVLAVIILLIMSESWIEPLLFLIAIAFSVIINVGSNSILPYTAEITFSIAPVIQMVLSMDYAIILLNRYRIERKTNLNKCDAMKIAISQSGASVISSSITTVVGLISLVFLSFKLGPELAIVLAKGVFISMICTFTVMPTLIIAFDKLIEKTKKRHPKMPVNGISKFAFKSKRVMPFIFALTFIAFAVLQNFTGITFTEGLTDPVAQVFEKNNAVVLLYDNEDEHNLDKLVSELEKYDEVNEVLGYTTTLGKEFDSSGMHSAISAMGESLAIDKSAIDIIYFVNSGKELPEITLEQLVEFIKTDVAPNPLFKSYIAGDLLSNFESIGSFLNAEKLTTPISASEAASIFGIDQKSIELIYMFERANSANFTPNAMTFYSFANFLSSDVVTNPTFSPFISAEMVENLELFVKISDKQFLQTAMSADQISQFFGIEKQSVQAVFLLSVRSSMTLPEFVNTILSNDSFASMMDEAQREQLKTLQNIFYLVLGDAKLSHVQTAEIAGAEVSDIKLLFTLHQTKDGIPNEWQLSPKQLVDVIKNGILTNPMLSQSIDQSTANLIDAFSLIIDDVIEQKAYSNQQFYQLLTGDFKDLLSNSQFEITAETVELLYIFYGAIKTPDENHKLCLIDLFEFMSNDFITDERFKNFLSDELKQTLLDSKSQLVDAVTQMKGNNYSRLVINTDFAEESPKTLEFIQFINDYRNSNFSKTSYLIGNSPMVSEMKNSFNSEYLMISLITLISIFLVVLLTFKNLIIPLMLTLIVQCGVYVTVTVIGIGGGYMYYLALLIVQSILMGATIDYGIVFSNCYIENRANCDVMEALKRAYQNSIHTILTSGCILVLVLLILGVLTSIAMIKQVCITLSIGAFIAILLILLMLPAMVVRFDKSITKKQTEQTENATKNN